jgi:hypothetical protein
VSHRPSVRTSITILAAAGILVGGANLATYAATGQPLILGHGNSAGTTTSLKNLGRGPALSLNSSKHAPPLTVNSSKMIKHLNANKVGGKTAAQINPSFVAYRLGHAGDPLSATQHFFKIPSPSGLTQIGVNGIWEGSTTGDEIQCLVVDQRVLTSMDVSQIYSLPTATQGDPNGNIVDETTFVTLPKHKKLLIGCQVSGAAPATIVQPIMFTFKKVSMHVKHGTPFTIGPKHSVVRRLAGR